MKPAVLVFLATAISAVSLPELVMPDQVAVEDNKMPGASSPWWGEAPNGGYESAMDRFVDEMVETAEHPAGGAILELEKMGQAIGRQVGALLDGLEWDEEEGRHRRRHHHGGRRDEEQRSMWELIKESKYTKRFARLVEDCPDIKRRLEDKDGHYTLFVPTDRAFDNMPKHGDRPSREFLEEILQYHLVHGRYSAGSVMASHTLPTVLELRDLAHNHQRLRVSVGLMGIHINFYSRVVATNMEACNGFIHAVDRIIVPPPHQGRLIEALPGKFSTFSLAMEKTGLGRDLHERTQRGGTVFVPTNYAFLKLGPRLNNFLFSQQGERYLRALMRYHVVANETLYSDAYYEQEGRGGRDRDDDDDDDDDGNERRRTSDEIDELVVEESRDCEDGDDNNDDDERRGRGRRDNEGRRHGGKGRDIWEKAPFPGGSYHASMPSMLGDKRVAVSMRQWMGTVVMTINGWIRVPVQDAISQDGVVHVVSSVLMPPRNNQPDERNPEDDYENDNMSIDELKRRLERYVGNRRGRHGQMGDL